MDILTIPNTRNMACLLLMYNNKHYIVTGLIKCFRFSSQKHHHTHAVDSMLSWETTYL